ncbi:hypothetical protein D779_1928 [Imhoffiella purpurea]|uniref:Uncharacterized protein n=2 Tax=Imhoffiella purpurea TaxID=1249627 RepID=W9V6P1_9GAMM|nr:hypothetical protein D779_1928 [Imhoffiella purpurea]
MFLATGFCEETGLTILGLSLANWALICFTLCAGLGGWLWWQSRLGSTHR